MPQENRRTLDWLTLGVFVVAGVVATGFFPMPLKLLSDHGHGYQLAGAVEILAGRHPFVDFRDVYGPLPHYASALAHRVAGGRVGGELGLVVVALACGYAAFFRLLCRVGVRLGWALAATALALVVQPAAFRYYLFCLPVLFLIAVWRYTDNPTRVARVGLAATVTLAGLFRPDLGVFTWGAGVVAIVTLGEARRTAWLTVVEFTGWVVAWALPWLGWLAAHGALGEYLADSSIGALAHNAGMARAFPAWVWTGAGANAQNAKALLFRLPAALLVLALAGLWWRRHEVRGAQRARLWAVAALAVGTQLQAMSIVDWMHVRDTLPWRIFLLAWLVSAGVPAGAARAGRFLWRWGAPAGAVAVALGLLGAVAWREPLRQFQPRFWPVKLGIYALKPEQFLARLAASPRAQLYLYLRAHSAPDEGVWAVIEAPQTNFFAQRRLAGGQLAIFPGFFASETDQQRLIERLRKERTAFVVLDHLGQDEYPELALEKFAPRFWAYLQEEFVEVKQIGPFRVLAPRGRAP